MALPNDLVLTPGVCVSDEKGVYRVIHIISSVAVLVEDQQGSVIQRLAAELRVTQKAPDRAPLKDLALLAADPRWHKSLRIAELLRPLIEMRPYQRTREDVARVADELGRHPSTVYRLIKEYEETGHISSLMRKSRSDKGKTALGPQVEEIITECINSFYLTPQRRSVAKTAVEVRRLCFEQGLPMPDAGTIRSRVARLDNFDKTRKREGYKTANEHYRVLGGAFPGADRPMATIQIDHTPVDVIVVDEVHRKPIGRPDLTIAIDVFSRMIVGFYISLDAPNELATGICISRAILDKEAYLKRLDLEDMTWPCCGLIKVVHTDNAMEFRGSMLQLAASTYGVILQRRPRGRPNYGGSVERAFKTFMSEVHGELPGATFSNPQHRLDYDSEGRAVMTLDALERWFAIFVLGVYHQRSHEGNQGFSPLAMWEKGTTGIDESGFPRGIPARYADEDRLYLDFLPFQKRTVQESGVSIGGVAYWSDALRSYINSKNPAATKEKRQFICRYDPRDMSKIWVFDEDKNTYIETPYRNLGRPPVSLWEIKHANDVPPYLSSAPL